MVLINEAEVQEPVLVDGCALPPLGSANTSVLEPHVPGAQRPLRRREPPPMVGRDNSATRYEVVKHRMHQLGVRRQRRWENLMGLKAALSAMAPVAEEKDEASIVQPTHTVLSSFLKSQEGLQRWEQLASEEAEIVRRLGRLSLGSFEDLCQPQSPVHRYLAISRSIRTAMRRRHLPMGLFTRLEADVVEAFSADPAAVLVLQMTDSFQRLMLHGISQYLGLESNSETMASARVTTIKHPAPEMGFVRPEVLLSVLVGPDHS